MLNALQYLTVEEALIEIVDQNITANSIRNATYAKRTSKAIKTERT